MLRLSIAGLALALLVGWCAAQDASQKPDAPVAATRWSLKETLEAHRSAKPRLPPPPLTDQEKAKGRSNAGQGGMRRLLDPEVRPHWPRDWLDANMPLTRLMRNELLWVTSRVNNCLY
jgi:hypothetical protein